MADEISHTVAFRGGIRIEILENTSFHAFGAGQSSGIPGEPGTPGTHHVIFTIGGNGVERLYYAQIDPEIVHDPNVNLIDYLLAGINTSRIKFLKGFNVVA